MTEEERQRMNDAVHDNHDTRMTNLEIRVAKLEKHESEQDLQWAIISTKLSAILWGIGIIATALAGVLVKILFGV